MVPPLKIRFIRVRDQGVLAGIIFVAVLGADLFLPWASGAPIGDDRRPRRGEDICVLDRELKMQAFAFVVEIDEYAIGIRAVGAAIFLFVLVESFLRGLVIDHAIALHQMQRLAL